MPRFGATADPVAFSASLKLRKHSQFTITAAEMSFVLHRYFTSKLLIRVEESALVIAEKTGDNIVDLDAVFVFNVCPFVRDLNQGFASNKSFRAQFFSLIKTETKHEFKFCFGDREILLSALEVGSFLKTITYCLPFTVKFGSNRLFVGHLQLFTIYLQKTITFELSGKFFSDFQLGRNDVLEAFFLKHNVQESKENIGDFLFFHQNIVSAVYSLRSIKVPGKHCQCYILSIFLNIRISTFLGAIQFQLRGQALRTGRAS